MWIFINDHSSFYNSIWQIYFFSCMLISSLLMGKPVIIYFTLVKSPFWVLEISNIIVGDIFAA